MAFDSLYTGITGLNSYQSWIDMISNNIANVDTTGFKGQSMTFADLFYQNQSFASGPTTTNGGMNGQQIGVGVKVNTIDTEFAQGGLQSTGNATDLAMNGDGFFILNNLQGNAAPVYTRDGHFQLNSNGVLYDPASGLAVQGWSADANGNVTPSGATGSITIPVGLQEQATATGAGVKVGPNSNDQVFDVAFGGNLDQTQWQKSFLSSIGASSANGAPYTVTTTMYDSLGNAHEAEITYTPDTTGAIGAQNTVGGAGTTINGNVSMASATNQADQITITSNGGNPGTYTIKDTLGTVNATYNAGSTVTVDGATFTLASPAAGAGSNTITVFAAQNGLPSVVANASGTSVTPATRWKVNVTFTDGTVFDTITQGGSIDNTTNPPTVTAATTSTGSSGTIGYAYFDQNGQFINSSSIETAIGPAGIGGAALSGNDLVHATGTNPSVTEGNLLNVTLWGTSAGNPAAAPEAIGMDFNGSALQGGMASLAGTYTANVISQNGYAAGTLDNITVSSDGSIVGSFTNGQNKTLAQVAVASFTNEDGLARLGNNEFGQTANSGLALVGVAGTGKLGSIQSGALEQSNVSLATEFTNLIIAQRAFEANTRGITTADQNIQTVINLRASEN